MAAKKKTPKQAAKEFIARVKSGAASAREIDSVSNVIAKFSKPLAKETLTQAKKKGKFPIFVETGMQKGLTMVEKRKRAAEKKKKGKQ